MLCNALLFHVSTCGPLRPNPPNPRICAAGGRHRFVAKSLMHHTTNTPSARWCNTFGSRNDNQITKWGDAYPRVSARLTAARSARPVASCKASGGNSPYTWSDRHIHFREGPPRCSGHNRVEGTPLASTACKTQRMSAKRPPHSSRLLAPRGRIRGLRRECHLVLRDLGGLGRLM